MTDRAEIERLLNQTGRTLEGLPEFYPEDQQQKLYREVIEKRELWENRMLHQSDVIELLVGALRDALEKPMQKPLTLTQANSYQDPMWIEFRVFKEASGWRDGLCDALNWAHRVYRDLNREAEFMAHYRLWRHRPTDEERSAAAWES
jgi:hypothetical protein